MSKKRKIEAAIAQPIRPELLINECKRNSTMKMNKTQRIGDGGKIFNKDIRDSLDQKFNNKNEIIGEQNLIFDSVINALSRENSLEFAQSNTWEPLT